MKKCISLVILILLNINIFATTASEVDAKRFIKTKYTIIDEFSGIEYQKDTSFKLIKEANYYCDNLVLNGKNDWHLPTIVEIRSIRNIKSKFDYLDEGYRSGKYWIYYNFNSIKNDNVNLYRFNDNRTMGWVGGSNHTKCIRGARYENTSKLQRVIKDTRNRKIRLLRNKKEKDFNRLTKLEFEKVKSKNTIDGYIQFINKYKLSKEMNMACKELYILVKYKNDIKIYDKFIHTNLYSSNKKELKIDAISNIYKLIKMKNNISGYEWFIQNYPNSIKVKEAISNIHKLAYDKVLSINTISAYNTFIIAYPYAKQIREISNKAYKIEEKKYTDLGMFGFFSNESKMEKRARKLLIKAKQIERMSDDYSGNVKAGYKIVANRMYDLLQEKFDDSEATLRYLESQEFRNFVKSFRSVMKDIKYTLNKINSNTSNIERYTKQMLNVSKEGFQSSKVDRDMASYKLAQHDKWEKLMHFRDKGYN